MGLARFALAATLLLAPGAAPLLARSQDGPQPADPRAGARFGQALAVGAGVHVVGAPFDGEVLPRAGAVYVFDAVSGTQLHKLQAADAEHGDAFGASVAVHAGRILVGAPADDDDGPASGSAYVFDLASGAQLFKLKAAQAGQLQLFGSAVALHNGIALIGAPGEADPGLNSGAAYLFDVQTGVQLTKLSPPDLADRDLFGSSVALDGNLGVVGAPETRIQNPGPGYAYLVDVPGLQLGAKLTAAGGQDRDGFGWSVALSGGQCAVGAIGWQDFAGAVYLFDATGPTQLATLEAPGAAARDEFGSSVALGGGSLLVGARHDDDFGPDSGAAFAFDSSSFALEAKLQPCTGQEGSLVGFAVALRGPDALVGAPGFQAPDAEMGRVLRFHLAEPQPGQAFCFGDACPCGNHDPDAGCGNGGAYAPRGALLTACGSRSVTQDNLELRTHLLPANTFAIVFMGSPQAPVALGNGLRCVGGSLYRFVPALNSGLQRRVELGPGIAALSCNLFGTGGCISAGSSWSFQTWYRDNSGPCGGSSNLSNALQVTFVP